MTTVISRFYNIVVAALALTAVTYVSTSSAWFIHNPELPEELK